MSNLDAKPALALGFRFQWEPAQECHVLLYPEGMVKLNETAAAILGFCDGERSVQQLISDLEREYEMEDLHDDVIEFLTEAGERGWVRYV